MDPLSHYMAGYFLGRRAGASPATLRAATLCAVLPDVDFVMVAGGLEAMGQWHRSFTHSFLGAVLIAALVVLGLSYFSGRREAMRALPWCLAGGMSHVVMDMFTYFRSVLTLFGVSGSAAEPEYLSGVMLFWPFTGDRYNVVDLGLLSPGVNGAAMAGMFCLAVAYVVWRARKGDYVWEVWTDLFIKEKVGGGKEPDVPVQGQAGRKESP